MDLPLLAALLLVFALTMYVMLDGFDLGVGALLLAQRDEQVRNRMVDAIAPTWDGNETWLVLAALTALAGFAPTAFSFQRSSSRSSSC
jgi:cytochrome d ubiquinol oxidase subunit II